jgi:hypothetical protein
MRLVESSDGEEAVARHNELSDSLDRLGVWVSLLESFAFQLVRGGSDFKTSDWLAPPARAAYRMYLRWAAEQTGTSALPSNVPVVVHQEPAASTQRGQELIGRLSSLTQIIGRYDLAMWASWNDLQGDFADLWSRDLPPWIDEQPISLEPRMPERRTSEDVDDVSPQPPARELHWDRVLTWQGRLSTQESGTWVPSERQPDGTFILGYATLSTTASAFVQTLYHEKVVASFDWGHWMKVRGRALYDDPQQLAACSLADCRRLLTAIVRGDRFTEGALLSALESGLIDRILGRVRAVLPS